MKVDESTMQAIYATAHGDTGMLKIQKTLKPLVKSGEALVRLKAAGINFIDIYMRQGSSAIRVPIPFIPGVEGSGIVEEVFNDVTVVKPGDRVAFVGHLGTYAEYITVQASQLIPLRENMTFYEGAAFPLQGMTAQYLVNELYPVKPGDHVLVHAAAGGVGLLTVQWLKHLGAHVIGTVSTREKAKIARIAGVDDVIIYTEEDFVTETKRLTNGKGVDYIIDGVGKSTFAKNLEAVRTRGCICFFGFSSGIPDSVDMIKLQMKSITLCGGGLMNYLSSREELLKRANQVVEGVTEGWLKLNVSHVFTLDQAPEAQRLLETRQTTGKLLLTIGEGNHG